MSPAGIWELTQLGPAGTLNLKVETITRRNLNVVEVAESYRQHTYDTGPPYANSSSTGMRQPGTAGSASASSPRR